MTAYTIHEPFEASATRAERADAVDFVKEGIAWWALFFPLFWLFYHRMWIILLGFIILVSAVPVGFAYAGLEAAARWTSLTLLLIFALHANDLRRWTLARRGYRMVGAVTGGDLTECELKFFSSWEDADPAKHTQHAVVPPEDVPPASAPEAPKTIRPKRPTIRDDDIIGLFPDGK